LEAILSSMGIWDRLESLLKSYLNDGRETVFTRGGDGRHSDPDVDAAYEELDDFLKGNGGKDKEKSKIWDDEKEKPKEKKRPVTEEIRRDFAELGLTPEASAEECKEAYKKLLKIHHPDRHANHEGNLKKATEKTARVNASYDRLEVWFRVQK
jgi:DnaJ-domain-containing protein 1